MPAPASSRNAQCTDRRSTRWAFLFLAGVLISMSVRSQKLDFARDCMRVVVGVGGIYYGAQ